MSVLFSAALKAEQDSYKSIPKIRNITFPEIEDNYRRIKDEVLRITESEIERIYATPELVGLLVAKKWMNDLSGNNSIIARPGSNDLILFRLKARFYN